MPAERPLTGLLGRGATWEGDLSFDGRVRLDGVFRGRLHTEDVLEIGEGGRVEGEVDAAVVRLAGTVDGRLRARRRLIIESTGCVIGLVQAAVLEVLPGARLHAQLQVGEAPPRPEPRPAREARPRAPELEVLPTRPEVRHAPVLTAPEPATPNLSEVTPVSEVTSVSEATAPEASEPPPAEAPPPEARSEHDAAPSEPPPTPVLIEAEPEEAATIVPPEGPAKSPEVP